MKLLTTLAATMMAMLPFQLSAEDDMKLSDFTFSETIVGEEPTNKYLKGKVVVIEYWGVR